MDDISNRMKGIKDYILDNKRKILILTVYICILVFVVYTIFEHIFHLTKFVIKYNEAFDFGKFLQGLCSKEYFEFETGRFQVTASQKDIQLHSSSKKYITFILVVAIIVSLLISILFTYVIGKTFYHWDWLNTLFDMQGKNWEDRSNQEKILYILYIILYPITYSGTILGKMTSFIYNNYTQYGLFTIVFCVMISMIYLLVLCVLIIMPTYIGLKLSDKDDISPFNTNYEVYVPYIVISALIIILRFSYIMFNNENGIISKYFQENVGNMFTSNNTSGYIAFFLLMAIYLTMYYILGNIINIYKKYNINPDYEEESSHSKSVLEEFMNKTFGYNEFNNFEIENVFIKNISGIVATLAIILVVVIVVFIIMYRFEITENERKLVKYGIIVPLLALLIIIFTSITSTQFNHIINKYILQNPSVLYKQYINILNNMLNPILQSEYEKYDNAQSGYICRNTGNAILLALYNDIFENISNISRSGEDGDETINITPEFEYDFACDTIDPFKFNESKEYDILFYFDGKFLKKNIFYKYNKCTSINTNVLTQMINNHISFLQLVDKKNEKISKKLMKEIYNTFYKGSTTTLTEDPGVYIKKVIFEKGDTYDTFKTEIKNFEEDLKKRIITCMINIEANNTYNDTKKVLITKDESMGKYYQQNKVLDIASFEVHQHNNNLDKFDTLHSNTLPTDINSAVNKIIEIYVENIYHFLYIYVPLWNLTIQQKCDVNDDKCQIIQDNFIEKMTANIKKTFDQINDILSQPLTNSLDNNMTKYIINNYNNVHTDKVYKKNWLETVKLVDTKNTNTETENLHILTYSNILKQFLKIYDDINQLILAFQTNSYHNVNFVITLKSSTVLCQTVIDKLKKENTQEFKDAINKSIFQSDSDKYVLAYKYKGKDKNLEKDLYDILIHMMELSIELVAESNKKYDILIGTDNSGDLNSIDTNINIYFETLKTNVGYLKYDMELQMSKSNNADKQIDPVDTLTIDQSRQITNDSIAADKIIYMLIVNYIISIILTNFIY